MKLTAKQRGVIYLKASEIVIASDKMNIVGCAAIWFALGYESCNYPTAYPDNLLHYFPEYLMFSESKKWSRGERFNWDEDDERPIRSTAFILAYEMTKDSK